MAAFPNSLREFADNVRRPVAEIQRLARLAGVLDVQPGARLEPTVVLKIIELLRNPDAVAAASPAGASDASSPAATRDPQPLREELEAARQRARGAEIERDRLAARLEVMQREIDAAQRARHDADARIWNLERRLKSLARAAAVDEEAAEDPPAAPDDRPSRPWPSRRESSGTLVGTRSGPAAPPAIARRPALEPLIDWLARQPRAAEPVFAGEGVVLLGRDPSRADEMRRALRLGAGQCAAVACDTAGVLIVGRDDWFIDDIEAQIRARAGRPLRIYSQELALLAVHYQVDPLAQPRSIERLLTAVAKDHPALACCREDGFDWPFIDTARLWRELDSAWDEGIGESPLHRLGYAVGKTSAVSVRKRREVLTQAFRGDIPAVGTAVYMRRWGEPGTRRRLRRMARHIDALIKVARARKSQLGHDMDTAIGEWTADLEWLRASFFESWMRFRWPATSVS